MKKVIISVLGQDRPGIIAAIARILFENDGNIENVSQTSLQSEFAGIFIVAIPDILSQADLTQRMATSLDGMDLQVHIKPVEPRHEAEAPPAVESFIITTRGPDQKGLVARVTEVIARHHVNVTNCQAVFKGGDDPNSNIMIYEVDIPNDADQQALRQELMEKARTLSLDISIQHKLIFEAINRI